MSQEIIILLAKTAFEEMARVNSTDIETVKTYVKEGNEIACSQFNKLMAIGFDAVNSMAAA